MINNSTKLNNTIKRYNDSYTMGMMLTLMYLPFVRTNDFLPGYRPTIKINTIQLCKTFAHTASHDTILYEMLFLRALESRHESA